MKFHLTTTLGCSALVLGACTHYVQPDPYAGPPVVEQRAPRFGANGTQSTVVTETTTMRSTTPTPDVSVADPAARTTSTTTTSGPTAASASSTTTASTSTPTPNTSATTTATSSVERKTALPHPDPELVRNPFNPSGPPLRIKNLSSGRADYKTGDEVMPDPTKPNQRVVIP